MQEFQRQNVTVIVCAVSAVHVIYVWQLMRARHGACGSINCWHGWHTVVLYCGEKGSPPGALCRVGGWVTSKLEVASARGRCCYISALGGGSCGERWDQSEKVQGPASAACPWARQTATLKKREKTQKSKEFSFDWHVYWVLSSYNLDHTVEGTAVLEIPHFMRFLKSFLHLVSQNDRNKWCFSEH